MSRSYLQSDSAVKKISGYITKKVASRLDEIFRTDRADYEQKWDDIKIFIEYGMLTDEKFCEAAMKFMLLKDTQNKYYTLEEYRTLVEPEQTDKEGNVVYLYATDVTAQYAYIQTAESRGYNVLVMDGQLDSHFIGLLEQKLEKTRIVRVDSDIIDNLIQKESKKTVEMSNMERSIMTTAFSTQIPKVEKAQFLVVFEAMKESDAPVMVTQNEYMRRMKEMSALQPGMNFYGELPDSYNLVVNTENPLVKSIGKDALEALKATVEPLSNTIADKNKEIADLRASAKDGKMSDEDQKKSEALEAEVDKARKDEEAAVKGYADGKEQIRQMIDLALLANGLLTGADLGKFISRSFSLLK